MLGWPSIPILLICTCIIALEKNVNHFIIKNHIRIHIHSLLNYKYRVTSVVSKRYIIWVSPHSPYNCSCFSKGL